MNFEIFIAETWTKIYEQKNLLAFILTKDFGCGLFHGHSVKNPLPRIFKKIRRCMQGSDCPPIKKQANWQ